MNDLQIARKCSIILMFHKPEPQQVYRHMKEDVGVGHPHLGIEGSVTKVLGRPSL